MRSLKYKKQFKRDYKREMKGRHKAGLDDELETVTALLLADQPLEKRYCDHALTGNWKGYRECHVKPDLLLVYEKPDAEILRLVRLGSHSELFV